METYLLEGERSGSSPSSSWENRRAYVRRSDAIAHGSPYQKAAALVDLAEDGIGLPEEIFDQSSFGHAAKFYLMFIKFDLIWTLNCFALIVLNFIEKPLWCYKAVPSCSDREYYFLGELPYLTLSQSLIYEVVTLIVLIIHTLFPIFYESFGIYWKSKLNKLKVLLLLVLFADLVVFAVYLSPVALNSLPFRIAPYIRVVFFILNIRDLRDGIVLVAGMLGTYLNVLALWLLFMLFSSWLAFVIFEDTQQGKTLFSSYSKTLLQMFVLFTTSNNPDVWIPAYKVSRWYSLFFVLYVLLGVYFVTNLILAVVYDSFKSELVKQVSEKDLTRRRILTRAFNLIDSHLVKQVSEKDLTRRRILTRAFNNRGFLDKNQSIRLFDELNNYRTLPKISRGDFELIFDALDDSHDFKINLDEFYDLCNAIALRFQKEESEPIFEKCPTIYHSPVSENLKDFVLSPSFVYVVALVLIMNLVAVVIETTLDIANSSGQKAWQKVEFVFGWLYVLEMALKVYTYGFVNYWRDGHNRFDFVITWVIVIGETATFISPNVDFLSNGEWIRYLLIARMLRLIRLLMHVKQYRAFVATFLTLIPSLMPYLGMIFCILCIYCSIAVQVFGGIVNPGNPRLDGTDLSENDYLLFNFNDYPSGMVTLFNLLVMGNWQVWMESYKILSGTSWTYVYFISFYLITILLLLNLVIAFVLEAFFVEMDLETSEKCEDGENKDESQKDRRRNMGTKTRSQRVDMLLHRMLSAELDKTESSTP